MRVSAARGGRVFSGLLVGAVLLEDLHDAAMTAAARHAERRAHLTVRFDAGVDVGATGDEQTDDLHLTRVRSRDQRILITSDHAGDVGAAGDELAHDIDTARSRSHDQWIAIPSHRQVDVGPGGEQLPYGPQVASFEREREAVQKVFGDSKASLEAGNSGAQVPMLPFSDRPQAVRRGFAGRSNVVRTIVHTIVRTRALGPPRHRNSRSRGWAQRGRGVHNTGGWRCTWLDVEI